MLLCIFGGVLKSKAQVNRFILNLPNYDKKQIRFGFTLGLTNNTLDGAFSTHLGNNSTSTVTRAEIQNFLGFNVGMITDYRLNKNFNLRFVPSLTITNRAINYSYYNPLEFGNLTILEKKDEAALFILPISIKFRAERRGNVRPYVFTGSQLTIDMSSDKNVEDPQVLRLKSTDFGLHAGLGLDFYLEFFKFGIEMRYNYGLTDLRVDDGKDFYNAVESLHHRGLQFSLTFE